MTSKLCCMINPQFQCRDKNKEWHCGIWMCKACAREGYLDDSGGHYYIGDRMIAFARCLPCSRRFRKDFYGDPDYE